MWERRVQQERLASQGASSRAARPSASSGSTVTFRSASCATPSRRLSAAPREAPGCFRSPSARRPGPTGPPSRACSAQPSVREPDGGPHLSGEDPADQGALGEGGSCRLAASGAPARSGPRTRWPAYRFPASASVMSRAAPAGAAASGNVTAGRPTGAVRDGHEVDLRLVQANGWVRRWLRFGRHGVRWQQAPRSGAASRVSLDDEATHTRFGASAWTRVRRRWGRSAGNASSRSWLDSVAVGAPKGPRDASGGRRACASRVSTKPGHFQPYRW